MQENERKVSVIVPVYNMEDYLECCLHSLLNQTYSNLEIILIDDGSVDKGGDICDRFALTDQRIQVFHQENCGVSAARNFGLKKATGDFIVFVDADDWVEHGYISLLVDTICTHNVDLVIIDYYIEVDGQKTTLSPNDDSVYVLSEEEVLNGIYRRDLYLGYLWNKIFLRRLITSRNLSFHQDVKIWEDLLFCCQYADCIKAAVYCRNAQYVYRQRENSAVNCETSKKEKSKLVALEALYRVAARHSGAFNLQTRNEYSNMLISAYSSGYMGLDHFDKEIIGDIICRVNNLNARLTIKHMAFYMIMKWLPPLAYYLAKRHCQLR